MITSMTKDLIFRVKMLSLSSHFLQAATFELFVHFHRELRDWHIHIQLQDDFVEHIWTHIGNQ
mgnify:CR=1 FL=1